MVPVREPSGTLRRFAQPYGRSAFKIKRRFRIPERVAAFCRVWFMREKVGHDEGSAVTKAGHSGSQPSTVFAAGPDDRPPGGLSSRSDAAARGAKAAKPELTGQIGNKLRSVYNEVLSQPVPDRFLDLLKDLDAVVAQKGAK
jgi:hypothetical protein